MIDKLNPEKYTTYEQPLNETVRVCLRLEQLFQQLDHQINDTSLHGTRTLIASFIHILHVVDRPDLKSKLAKELSYHMDKNKCHPAINQLENLVRRFIDSSGKIGQKLREIELLNNLKLHLATPGGGCSFDIPVYHYWLQQPADERKKCMLEWLQEFDLIRSAFTLLLQLVRDSSKTSEKIAEHGFYQDLLDPQNNLRLIRVTVLNSLKAYPEISVGRHFLSVRYFSPNVNERPTKYIDNVSFWLSYCSY